MSVSKPDLVAEDVPPKRRGPGRPRKSVPPVSQDNAAAESVSKPDLVAEDVPPKRRGPCRPKKSMPPVSPDNAAVESVPEPDPGTEDVPPKMRGSRRPEKSLPHESPDNAAAWPLTLPGIDIERLMQAGPEAVGEALAKKASYALVGLAVALLYQTEYLKRENARLADENKKLILANTTSKKCRLNAVAETNAYAAGNKTLLNLLSSLLAGTVSSTIEIGTEIDRLVDIMGKPRKDSTTSSSPPSKDNPRSKALQRIARAREKAEKGQEDGKPGAKKGHEAANRPDPDPKDWESAKPHDPDSLVCPDCNGTLRRAPDHDELVEQYEIPPEAVERQLHRVNGYVCDGCGHHHSNRPSSLKTGILGPRLLSLLTVLKFSGHMSYEGLRKFLQAMGANVSKGTICNALYRVSESVRKPYEELLEAIRTQPVVNADETGHKENGASMWIWTFVASAFTVFCISASRSCAVLELVLGTGFSGILGSDFYGAYTLFKKKAADLTMQLCWAHLIRELKNLSDNRHGERKVYGKRLLELKTVMFSRHHEFKEDPYSITAFSRLQASAAAFLHYAIECAPNGYKECMNIVRRLRLYGDAYFTFIYRRDVEPTNNLAEQSIRYWVIDRLVTHGTRSEKGRERLARMLTVIATCQKRGHSPYDYFLRSITAWCKGDDPPSMLDL
jgi:hypothetical protein